MHSLRISIQIIVIILLSACAFGCSRSTETTTTNVSKLNRLPRSGKYIAQTLQRNGREYLQIVSMNRGLPGGSIAMYGGSSPPKTFNRWAATDSLSTKVTEPMFDGLVGRNPYTGEVVPALAENFELRQGGREIIVRLRKGLQWSDGMPITSADVLFTWNDILRDGLERLGARESLLVDGHFPSVEAIDDLTISFKTPRVFAPLLGELGYPIAPMHCFADKLNLAGEGLSGEAKLAARRQAFSAMWNTDVDPQDLAVSGAFKLKKYIPGERILYVRNDSYYRVDPAGNGLPYLDSLTMLILPTDNLEFFRFISGKIPLWSLSAEWLPVLAQTSVPFEVSVYDTGPVSSTMFVAFNMSRRGTVPEPQSGWFNNLSFRRALNAALDRNRMIEAIYLGVGAPICFSEDEQSIFFDGSYMKECRAQADLEVARDLLLQGGFTFAKDGSLQDSNGHPVRFSMYTNAASATDSLSDRVLLGEMVREQWGKLGITVDLKQLEFNNLVVRMMQTGDWQSVIMGLSGGDLFEPNSAANVWLSDARLHIFDQRPGEVSAEDKRNWELEIDEHIRLGTAQMEFAERAKHYHAVQRIIWEQQPLIYLAKPRGLFAVREDYIGNFQPTALAGAAHNIEQWYLLNPKTQTGSS